MKLLILALVAAGAYGACIDGCSGHGYCGAFDMCTCYPNWGGTNCGGRACPSTKAWADVAIADDDAHNYATCGNKGDCDSKSAECSCYDGYEGKGCRRSSCPNDCSGHGTCQTMRELAAANHCPWDHASQARITKCWDPSVNVGATGAPATAVFWDATNLKFNGIQYDLWDADKIQACVCDPGYSGTDCSGRICPKGDDPLRTRGPVNGVNAPDQVHPGFELVVGLGTDVYPAGADTKIGEGPAGAGRPASFILSFVDTYNERWYTRPIPLLSSGTVYQASVGASDILPAASLTGLANNIKRGLLDLPNGAVTGTASDPITGLGNNSEALAVTCVSQATATDVGGEASADFFGKTSAKCTVTFQSAHNSGHLLNRFSCHVLGCTSEGSAAGGALTAAQNPGGCFPKYEGLTLFHAGGAAVGSTYAPNSASGACLITPVASSGTTDEDTCSARGSCDGGSGLCQCHEGYTDEDCHMQTVLQ